jgi:hypothetical protein
MNKLILAALLSVASVSSFAQEVTVFDADVASPRSRAEVRAEVRAALAAGEQLGWGEARAATIEAPRSALTRAEVRDAVEQALARGERLHHGEAQV